MSNLAFEAIELSKQIAAHTAKRQEQFKLAVPVKHLIIGVGHPCYPKALQSVGRGVLKLAMQEKGYKEKKLQSMSSTSWKDSGNMFLVPELHDPKTLARVVFTIMNYHKLKTRDLTVIHNDGTKKMGTMGISRAVYNEPTNVNRFVDALTANLKYEGGFRRIWIGTKLQDDRDFLVYDHEFPRGNYVGKGGKVRETEHSDGPFHLLKPDEYNLMLERIYPLFSRHFFPEILNEKSQKHRFDDEEIDRKPVRTDKVWDKYLKQIEDWKEEWNQQDMKSDAEGGRDNRPRDREQIIASAFAKLFEQLK